MDQAPELVTEVVGGLGRITLDRPRALNALSFEMCRGFDAALEAWAGDERVRAVLIRSASERAFSTGADVLELHHARDRLEAYAYPYYRLAYTGNARLFHFPKPFVALIDGIVMGVGVGVSVHGSHRVVSENLVFAMPETGFRNNEVRLRLHALAYNLGNFLRTLALPEAVEHWSLTTLREKLIKIGAKVVRHGRYITFQMAEVAIPRTLFVEILRLIDGLRPAPLPP